MAKNEYAKRLREQQLMRERIVKQWTAQLCLDTMAEVLNDPKIMGKDVLGKTRLTKVCEGFNACYFDRMIALTRDPEADYVRAKIDEKQKQIFGSDALTWSERYECWTEDNYGGKR